MRRVMNIAPGRAGRLLLGLVPFVLLALVYVVSSAERRAVNPDDKLLPPVSEMADAVRRVALEPDRRTEEYVLWADTAASLRRLGLGLGIATLIGLVLGVAIGTLPFVRAALAPLVAVICMVPPMAILPVLFIVFGLGELSKVVLILIGISPFLVRDLAFAVDKLPVEQIVKAQSLGASTWQVAIRRGDSIELLPSPPAPVSLFHVLDQDSSAALADARRRFPDDPLLLGVLHARFGMQQTAIEELRKYAARHSDVRNAAALADSVSSW